MQNINLTSLVSNANSPKYDPLFPLGDRDNLVIADYRFDLTDTMLLSKNGFSWDGQPPMTFSAPLGFSEKGAEYLYVGSANPADDSTIERRFTFNPRSELCVRWRFHVPANYFHRACLELSVTGDISSWQVGDTIVGGDATSQGKLYYKNGQTIYLLFAENNLFSSIWTATITNDTRSQSRTSTRVSNEVNNNKVLALWCDGYSAAGASPSIVWEMHADELGGSNIYYHFGADYGVTGNQPNSTSNEVSFITTDDVNKWVELEFYIKMATSESSENGIIRTRIKRDTDTDFVLLHQQNNAKIGARAAGGNANFQHGYCHGWANSGYELDTTFRDSRFTLLTTTS